MVVEQRVELRNMGARVTAGESQVDKLRGEVEWLKRENTGLEARLRASESQVKELKGEVEELQKEVVNQRVELSITKNELHFHKNKVEPMQQKNFQPCRPGTASENENSAQEARLSASERGGGAEEGECRQAKKCHSTLL
ncbi:uncharacterized protein ACWYII_028589 [Salvelinus alpinus]